MHLNEPTRLTAAVVTLFELAACCGNSAATAQPAPPTQPAAIAVDVLIRGGSIFNGDDLERTIGDVGVVGDRIAFVGRAPEGTTASRTIDATGMAVTPGFIDAHTHVDGDLLSDNAQKRLNLPFVTQGVTTSVIGNDGYGSYDIAGQPERMRVNPPGTNAAMFVGFGPVRQNQLGNANVAPTAAQLETMKQLVSSAMCHGAIGLSTGLYYTPQNFSTTEEVIEIAKVAGAHGGLYDSHIRDEQTKTGLPAAVEEALRIGLEASMPVHIAHIKALGADVKGSSGNLIRMIETAQANGQKVTADQ